MRSGRLGALVGALSMMFANGSSIRTPAPRKVTPSVRTGRMRFGRGGNNRAKIDRALRNRRNKIARRSRAVNRRIAANG